MPFDHLAAVLEALDDLGTRFVDAGHRLYLVGGIVRDQLLDQPLGTSADIDLTTDARPDAIKTIVAPVAQALWTQGERFGTIGLKHRGHSIEITTHRAEVYDPDSRKPVVSFGDEIEVDLSRRDFTINAMAIELPGGELVDPWQGADDLEARRLRTPLSASVSFGDDPLRMLRAARFLARFALTADPDLVAAATSLSNRLDIVAIERIGAELERLFDLDSPRVGVEFLISTGLLDVLFARAGEPVDEAMRSQMPAAAAATGTVGGGWHRRVAVLASAIVIEPDRVAALAAGLRLSRADQNRINDIARNAESARSLSTDRPALRRWILACRDRVGALDAAAALVTAEAASDPTPGQSEQADRLARVTAAIGDVLSEENLDDMALLGGAEIMELLDLGSSPKVGEAVEHLRSLVIEHGPIDEARQRDALLAWFEPTEPG